MQIDKISLAILSLSVLFLLNPIMLLAKTEHYTGNVVSVADGDTFTILTSDFERFKVRLYGVDSPEKKQPYGVDARQYLDDLLYGKTVELEVKYIDMYSRYVSLVYIDNQLVNNLVIAEGYAWIYKTYCKQKDICQMFEKSEIQARKEKKGLWVDKSPIAPWDWRNPKDS
jgi:micrococcal nuclease